MPRGKCNNMKPLQPIAKVRETKRDHEASINQGVEMSHSEAEQFELELCWCIQQLKGLHSQTKMSAKQAQDATHTLNVLKSKNAPFIKKRQAMRACFGDYRAKMAKEEKKFQKVNFEGKMKTYSPSKNSQFLRVASVMVKDNLIEQSQNAFKFNFSNEPYIEDDQNASSSQGNVSEDKPVEEQNSQSSEVKSSPFKFVPSDNSFRFNFTGT